MTVVSTHHPNNLPLWSNSFIGREPELVEIRRLVASSRLLTLTGPGGCGKTRLVGALADKLITSPLFEHGAWFIDLAGLDDPLAVPQTLAKVLGVPETNERLLMESVADFLQDKKCLLILDNCEHLLLACAEVAQTLLAAGPQVHILATSREPLNLADETVWLVPSLTLPDSQALPLKHLEKCEAIQLFAARARSVLPGFTLNEANASTVEQICRRLDGIPLAIELAAARVKLLDVGQIADRLDDSLQLLTRGRHSATPRHQTMRAALDWSYHLLTPLEQTLFQRLAVFAGNFTLEDVEAVCADEPARLAEKAVTLAISSMLDALTNLVDKSLVLIAERTAGEAVRYRLLEVIRQYALDRLRETGREAAMRDRHLAYFVDLAERAELQLKSESQLRWLKHLDKELGNLRAALAWSTLDANRYIAGLRLAKALHLFWQRRGYWREGWRELEQAIANYAAHEDLSSPSGNFYLARAIVAQGWLAVYLQDYANIRGSLERGLALAQESGDAVTVAHALGLLSFLSSYAGDSAAAFQLATASVASARQTGEIWSVAWTLHVLGRNRHGSGDEQAARPALEESAALFRQTGDRRMLAVHINTMAIVAENAGELEIARGLFEEVLAIGQALEDIEVQLKTLSNLAGLALVQGDLTRAEQLYEQVIARAQAVGTQLMVGNCLTGLARIRIVQGDFATAERLLREGLAWIRKLGNPGGLALVLAGLSRIAVERGQAIQAARTWGAIDSILKRRRDADDRFGLDQWEIAVRAALPAEEFERAFVAGQALTLEQAVQEVTSPARENVPEVQRPTQATQMLQLKALGPTQVFLGEQALTTWPYARVKELLFYLISQPARTKAQLGLDLWPEASPAQLRNSLSTTLYHVRRALGNAHWIVFEDGLYRFNCSLDYQFDVELFEANLVQSGRQSAQAPDRAITLLQQAVTLYQGDFMEDFVEGEWFLLRRENLRQKYLKALLDLGQLLFARGDFTRAAETYRRAIAKDEVLEEAHRELMRCYARLGERGQALRHYQVFAQMMRDELDTVPAVESNALYERLKRGEEV